ncbi:MAG TPA: hypothetical protein VF650_02080 [Allosphingosinicella sp.]|jgi:hypothetical protein
MKFFVPYAADDDHSEAIWSDSRADLFDLGFRTTKRRIWALSLDVYKPYCLLHIGREVPDDHGPAMLIFEASDRDVYFVCTPWNGVLGGEPFVLALSERGRAVDFEEVIEGHA